MLLEMIEEVLEEQNLSEAGLGGAGGLTRYKGRMSVFLKRLKQGTAFMTIDNVPFTFPPNENTRDIIDKLEQIIRDLDEGKPITSAKDERYKELSELIKLVGKPLNQILKDKELGGEVAGKRLKAEERQIGEIKTAIDNAVKQNGGPIQLYVGARGVVSIDGVKNVTGTPKADCALTLGVTPKAYVSLKSAASPNQMGQWGGITNYMSNPEIAKFIADLYLLQDKLKDPRLDIAYYRVLKSEPEQYVYGKNWKSNEPSENSCDFVLASKKRIQLVKEDPTKNVYKFSSDNIFYKPQVPSEDWKPTLYGRYATGRNDAGLQNIRLSVSPLGYRKNTNDLPQFDDSAESRALESQSDFKLEDMVAPTDIYDRERVSYQDADAEEIERVQQQMGRASLEEQIEIEIIDTEGT